MTGELQPISWKPRSFQATGVKLMLQQACAGLLYKPGRGKTSVVYMAFRILQDKQYVEKLLVICPLRPAYNVWPEQKNKYKEFQHLRVGVMHGPGKEAVLQSDDFDIYVINPEGLSWLFGVSTVDGRLKLEPTRVAYVRKKFQMLVVDESTDFKNSQTSRFKLLKLFVPYFKRRYILTGTIRPQNLLDLFGQIYILDEGHSLGRFITHYRTNYFYPSGYGGHDSQPQPDAKERIASKIAPLVQVVDTEAGLGLPELLYNDIYVDLPPRAWQEYRRMEEEMISNVEAGTVVAENAAIASSKCRQIANGCIYHGGEEGGYSEVHDVKLTALEGLLEQLGGEPALITYEFAFDADRIAGTLRVPSISTGSPKKDAGFIAKFSRGELPAVMGHPQSISMGIDGLQESCHDIIMYGVTWRAKDYEQVIDRVRRSGSKAKVVTVHRILARGTVDERVIKVLDNRMRDQKDFLTLLRTTPK